MVGLLFALATPVGLLTLQSALAHKAPTIPWIVAELRAQPLVYGYLLLSTLVMMVCLGWILGRKEDLLEAMTVTDPLTGLANRRRLRTQFAEELNRANRYGTPLALLLIDMDRLKLINDQAGHAAGDRALGLIAEALRRSCRTTDLAARHGGDEFVVLAVNTTATEALALAHRIRANVRRVGAGQIKGDNGEALRLSVSIGAADLNAAMAANFEGLHAAADHALYQAKAEGRDRVVVAPQLVRTGTRLRLVQSSLPSNDR
ncbi:MAG TPA: GGDEF domain-containing protein [Polyangia bacterium]|nr:GGDEF domain-containing protein [Polyangia bacterium]